MPRPFGATVEPGGVRFRVWAPGHERVEAVVYGPDAERLHPLEPEGEGHFSAPLAGVGAGRRYRLRLDGGDVFPDPASRAQPDGVHGASEIVDPAAFRWTDAGWRGVPMDELVLYELHVGTATPAGTFDALIGRLDHLVELGVNALELMPVAAFPGERGWGYDGVYLFAPHAGYGGPEGLRRLVDAAHARGLAIILDVVYNHFGPEGNYLPAITSGRIFTERHHTPWGAAVNYDGPESGPVREMTIQNALHWAHEYHLDGLRLDATHAILDDSETHILRELAERVRASLPEGRHFVFIAEDERNERAVVTPGATGGVGLDGVWADDLHHQLRRLAAGDREGYYEFYEGTAPALAETLRRGWYYQGEPYGREREPRGTPAADLPPRAFIHCIQNHDQVGNRALGERLNHQVEPAVFRAASALLLLSPYTPMLWMGQEWAASTPFLYFTDHPEELGRRVTEGRREEFRHFSVFGDPGTRERIPDPQAPETFFRSRLRWEERERPEHAGILALHRELLRLRRTEPALRVRDRAHFRVAALGDGALALRREAPDGSALLLVAVLRDGVEASLGERGETHPPEGRSWQPLLDTEEARFGGGGATGRLESGGILHLSGPGALLLRVARLGGG
jgi:maltooligosyltrehalose trehalohydrolase